MDRIKIIVLVLCTIIGSAAYAEHGPLLPRPQQIHYGSGNVALRGMTITFSSSPDAEDSFAANEFCSWVRERTGLDVSIGSNANSSDGPLAIVLDRKVQQMSR